MAFAVLLKIYQVNVLIYFNHYLSTLYFKLTGIIIIEFQKQAVLMRNRNILVI